MALSTAQRMLTFSKTRFSHCRCSLFILLSIWDSVKRCLLRRSFRRRLLWLARLLTCFHNHHRRRRSKILYLHAAHTADQLAAAGTARAECLLQRSILSAAEPAYAPTPARTTTDVCLTAPASNSSISSSFKCLSRAVISIRRRETAPGLIVWRSHRYFCASGSIRNECKGHVELVLGVVASILVRTWLQTHLGLFSGSPWLA
eukprot:4731911-Pleurochrysis_carterae.AAC.3